MTFFIFIGCITVIFYIPRSWINITLVPLQISKADFKGIILQKRDLRQLASRGP